MYLVVLQWTLLLYNNGPILLKVCIPCGKGEAVYVDKNVKIMSKYSCKWVNIDQNVKSMSKNWCKFEINE